MKYFLFLFAVLTLVGCNTNTSETYKDLALLDKSEMVIEDKKDYTYYYDSIATDEYKIKFGVNELKKEEFELVISMELLNDSYFVSPNAKRDFKGKFTIQTDESSDITFIGDIDEIPRSIEEYDLHPFVRGKVNWVREDTKYYLKVKRNSKEDFTVSSNLQFVIEPKCTLEEIPLFIRNQGGYLKFEVRGC
ncbi:hypothetical protein J1N09_06235 [Aureitalea sp. L0-47]|uniref:hypothetical protein n=1 Tax=Aureitalea sp. L0-47 TaxID=2816962 RepID=UPI002237C115|nr:hypothetical protein [Aureitalea sp. L0-47]MCW5519427.1 hypothetical protein [Aureitalea sp. L0-47]